MKKLIVLVVGIVVLSLAAEQLIAQDTFNEMLYAKAVELYGENDIDGYKDVLGEMLISSEYYLLHTPGKIEKYIGAANKLRELGYEEIALDLLKKAFRASAVIHGPESEKSISLLKELAELYDQIGKKAVSEALNEKVRELSKKE